MRSSWLLGSTRPTLTPIRHFLLLSNLEDCELRYVLAHVQTAMDDPRSPRMRMCCCRFNQSIHTSRQANPHWTSCTESAKDRNSKSPQFSVADVPVASQTAVGMPCSSKNRKKDRHRLRVSIALKNRKDLGSEKLLGLKHRCVLCPALENRRHNRREIATLGALNFLNQKAPEPLSF